MSTDCLSVSLIIYPNNDCVLEIQTRDPVYSNAMSGAAVTYQLIDSGVTIDSGAMAYVDVTTTGYYRFRVTLKDTLNIVAGKAYELIVNVDDGADRRGSWAPSVVAQKRI